MPLQKYAFIISFTVLCAIVSTIYLIAQRTKRPKIVIEEFDLNDIEEEEDMDEDQPGVQSELEVAAVEYVRNANQETLAALREAAVNYAAPKKKAPAKKTKK